MAIIYSYPYIAPKPGDLIVGTSVVEPLNGNSNEEESITVSWKLQDVIDLVATSTGAQTLQQVTSLGDSTTNPIILNNYLSLGGAVLDQGGDAGTMGQVLSSTVTGTSWVANTGQGVTAVNATVPIISSGSLTPTISLNNSGVNPGTYVNPTINVDIHGRILTASSGSTVVNSITNTFPASGYISGTSNATASGVVDLGTINLSATGTADATTFLRGDNTWAVPSSSYTSWSATGDNQSPAVPIVVTDSFNLKFTGLVTAGGAGITTDSAISANEMTVALTNTGGTPSATTFYRGDGQWATPSSTGVTGNGTQYQLSIWDTAAGTNLGDSKVYQDVNDDTVFLGTSSNYLKVTTGQNAFDCLQSSSNLTLRAGGSSLARSQIYLGNSTGSYFYGGAASTSGNYGAAGYGLFMQPGDGDFLVRGNTTEDYLRVKGITNAAPGEIVIAKYGSGTNTGTAAYNLSVDSTGKIIETANSSNTNTFVANATITDWSSVQASGIDLAASIAANKVIIINKIAFYVAPGTTANLVSDPDIVVSANGISNIVGSFERNEINATLGKAGFGKTSGVTNDWFGAWYTGASANSAIKIQGGGAASASTSITYVSVEYQLLDASSNFSF